MSYFQETQLFLSNDAIVVSDTKPEIFPEVGYLHIRMVPSKDYEYIDSIIGNYHGRSKTYVTNFDRSHIDQLCSSLRGRGTLREKINEICPSLSGFINGFCVTLIVTEFWDTDDLAPITRKYGIKPKDFTHLRELSELLRSDTHPWLREMSAWSGKYYQAFIMPDRVDTIDISRAVSEMNLVHKKLEVELLRIDDIRSEIEDMIDSAGRIAINELQSQMGCITDEIIRRCINHIKNNVDMILAGHLKNISYQIDTECGKVLEKKLPDYVGPYLDDMKLTHHNLSQEITSLHRSIVDATLLPRMIMDLRDRVMKLESKILPLPSS